MYSSNFLFTYYYMIHIYLFIALMGSHPGVHNGFPSLFFRPLRNRVQSLARG